jgi:hypothetical protein
MVEIKTQSGDSFEKLFELKLTKNVDRILNVGDDVYMVFSYHLDKEK